MYPSPPQISSCHHYYYYCNYYQYCWVRILNIRTTFLANFKYTKQYCRPQPLCCILDLQNLFLLLKYNFVPFNYHLISTTTPAQLLPVNILLCFYEFDDSVFLIYDIMHICPSMTGLSHLV